MLEDIIAETGTAPTYLRCDNGPEFTAAAQIEWCNTAGVDTAFIDPGSPWQNGLIESFNAQFRREQLSGEIMDTMTPKRYWETWTQENQLACVSLSDARSGLKMLLWPPADAAFLWFVEAVN